MRTSAPALLATVLVALGIAASLNLWAWLDTACDMQFRRVILKTSGSVGCFEFWLNRYQTLVASVIAFAAAVSFGIPAWYALKFTRRQSALSQWSSAADLYNTNWKDRSYLTEIAATISALNKIFQNINYDQFHKNREDFTSDKTSDLSKMIRTAVSTDTRWSPDTLAARVNFIRCASECTQIYRDIININLDEKIETKNTD